MLNRQAAHILFSKRGGGMVFLASVTMMLAALTAVTITTTVQANETVYCKEQLTIDELLATNSTGDYVNHNYSNVIHKEDNAGTDIDGTDDADLIIVSGFRIMYGNGGDDCIIQTGGVAGSIRGGPGDDYLYASSKTTINGNQGDDHLYGGSGTNTLHGNEGNDTIYGGSGNDTIYGGSGNDTIYGGSGNDSIYGGYLTSSDGTDYIVGGPGNDTIQKDPNDTIHQDDEPVTETPDANKTYCTENLTIPQLISSGIYNVIDERDSSKAIINGTTTNDLILIHNNGANVTAKQGNDCIIGGAGNDNIDGGACKDVIYGGPGDDTIHGGDEIPNLVRGPVYHSDYCGAGDIIYGGPGIDEIHGNDGQDYIDGDGGNDKLYGGEGKDTIYGDYGNDLIEGGPGNNDQLNGGPGNDMIYQDASPPTAGNSPPTTTTGTTVASEPKTQQRTASVAAESTYCKENLTIQELIASNIYNVIDERDSSSKSKITGTNADDLILVHDQGANVKGKKGNDCIIGGAGADDLRGNKGNDWLHGDENDRRIAGGQGNDTCTDTPNTKSNCENLN